MSDALRVLEAVKECHAQRGDDRCWMDVLKVYEAAGLPPPDTSVGDKIAMLKNCERFVERYCTGGAWPTYAQLEAVVLAADAFVQCVREFPGDPSIWSERLEALDAAVSATPTTKTHAIDAQARDLTDADLEAVTGGKGALEYRAWRNRRRVFDEWLKSRAVAK